MKLVYIPQFARSFNICLHLLEVIHHMERDTRKYYQLMSTNTLAITSPPSKYNVDHFPTLSDLIYELRGRSETILPVNINSLHYGSIALAITYILSGNKKLQV